MNRSAHHTIYLLLIFIQLNCSKSDSVSIVPKIEYLGTNKKQLKQGDLNQDTLTLQFKFEDGDGDVGFGSTNTQADIIVMDSRTGNIQDSFKLPDLPPSENDLQRGVVSMLIFTTCCLFPDGTPPCESPVKFPIDSLQYRIYLKDKSGHVSNIISSEYIYLLCQ